MSSDRPSPPALLKNLLHFSRLLRAAGVDVPAGRVRDVAEALTTIDLRRRDDVHHTVRALLVHRQQDLATFDEAFRLFWRARRASGVVPTQDGDPDEGDGPRRRELDPSEPLGRHPSSQAPSPEASFPVPDTLEQTAPLSYSSKAVSDTKDFADLSEDEMARAEAALARLEWNPGQRRTRRWRRGKGSVLDFRRLAREQARPLASPTLPTRVRTRRARPLVLVCDVSGSMERYVRMLLAFVQSLATQAGVGERVEVFVMATSLHRVTAELRRLGRRRAFSTAARAAAGTPAGAVARLMPDWGGGTRIGEALRTLNVRWARRVLSRGAVVLLISDGWDRGEPDVLRGEMGRLHRRCHRLIWLNPLLGSPEYQPLTRGMQAALPFIDDFLPVHNLSSLEQLAGHLNRLPRRSTAGRLPGRVGTRPAVGI